MAIVHRLFFALQPSAPQQPHIARHRDGLENVQGLVADSRLHVTLAATENYQDFPAAEAYRLHALGAAINAEPVAISLAQVTGSPGSVALRPAGRTSRELRLLHKHLAAPMAEENLLRAGWRFRPHMTLAYRQNGKPYAVAIAPIDWESHEFVLIHSEVGATRHHRLGRWPLYWRQGRLF